MPGAVKKIGRIPENHIIWRLFLNFANLLEGVPVTYFTRNSPNVCCSYFPEHLLLLLLNLCFINEPPKHMYCLLQGLMKFLFSIFYFLPWKFDSPQVKQDLISSIIDFAFFLPRRLPSDLKVH